MQPEKKKDEADVKRLKKNNVLEIPEVFRRYSEAVRHDSGDADISVTSLIDSPQIRKLFIEHADEIESDLADEILALLGTAIHEVLAKGYGDDEIVEMRLSADYAGYTVSGQMDLLTPTGELHEVTGKPIYDLNDVKSISGMKLAYNKGSDPSWEKQLNVYRLLCEDNGYHIRSLFMNGVIKDWSSANVRNNADFPDNPFVRKPVYMWELDEAREYVEQRVKLHFETEEISCEDEERWATRAKWAVYGKTKTGNRTKYARKVFESEVEADQFLAIVEAGKGDVEMRPGRNIRCESWCNVAEFCEQNREAISR